MKNDWFKVDQEGLAKILRRRGIQFAIFELVQNAWDENGVTAVDVILQPGERGRATLSIRDNSPAGFADLSHAFTLFAESAKKGNPEKRGRFNLGEKLVIAICSEFQIVSTGGGVRFDDEGRHTLRAKRDEGTEIVCTLKMTRTEIDDVVAAVENLIAPRGIVTTFNGKRLAEQAPLCKFTATLPTVIADDEGALRNSTRQTVVELYEVAAGREPMICEMGIPVVAHDSRFTANIMQKVPVTLDRENVRPAFLSALRVAMLNNTHDKITADDANSAWTAAAIQSPEASPDAVRSFVRARFGEKVVSFDPSDPEANKIATSQGFTVVSGGMLNRAAWENVRSAGAIQPAGKVTPSAKVWTGEGNPDAKICEPIPINEWTHEMRDVASYCVTVAIKAINRGISVRFYCSAQMIAAASYGGGVLSFNKFRLGAKWFNRAENQEAIDDLLIHELGHEYSGDHLSEDYYNALTKIAARMVQLARAGEI
jgi:hypothetical protein